MRYLFAVITDIIKLIPHNQQYEGLIRSLRSAQDSSSYAAPEAQYMWWRRTAEILESELGEIDTPWKQEIAEIFSGKKDE